MTRCFLCGLKRPECYVLELDGAQGCCLCAPEEKAYMAKNYPGLAHIKTLIYRSYPGETQDGAFLRAVQARASIEPVPDYFPDHLEAEYHRWLALQP